MTLVVANYEIARGIPSILNATDWLRLFGDYHEASLQQRLVGNNE